MTKILAISDIHAYSGIHLEKGKPAPSYCNADDKANPLTSLRDFASNHKLEVDLLICAGDLVERADRNALASCWSQLNSLRTDLNNPVLIATPGNHDLDSKFSAAEHDPKDALQALIPHFPNQESFYEFWSMHATLSTHNPVRVLNINTAAYHGYQNERTHGRISAQTLKHIKQRLDQTDSSLINIAVCHHPPHEQSENGQGVGDCTHEGDDLIELLDSGDYGQWLIIYGHKHFPKLMYSRGSGVSPVLLSCAAACAIPPTIYGRAAVNQFHIVEFDHSDIKRLGLVGIVKSYEWDLMAKQWREADSSRGLPKRAGFGLRLNPVEVSEQIISFLPSRKPCKWEDILKLNKDLNYLDHNIIRRAVMALKSMNCNVDFTEDGVTPYELQKL